MPNFPVQAGFLSAFPGWPAIRAGGNGLGPCVAVAVWGELARFLGLMVLTILAVCGLVFLAGAGGRHKPKGIRVARPARRRTN
jgi:hypothetical protein